VFPCNLLRVVLAWLVRIRIEMTRVGALMVRVISRDAERLQERFQLQKDRILASPEDVCQHLATPMINGMPEPPLRVSAVLSLQQCSRFSSALASAALIACASVPPASPTALAAHHPTPARRASRRRLAVCWPPACAGAIGPR